MIMSELYSLETLIDARKKLTFIHRESAISYESRELVRKICKNIDTQIKDYAEKYPELIKAKLPGLKPSKSSRGMK